MRQSNALASCLELVEHPLPARATRQLRLALEMLPDQGRPGLAADGACSPSDNGPDAMGGVADVPQAMTATGVLEVVGLTPHPYLAWPERPPRARMADGSAAPRRPDFYDWLLTRRRRAQIAARRAIAEE